MNSILRSVVVSSCFLICTSLCVAREEIWTEVNSPNLKVISDASPKQARRAARMFEQFRLLIKTAMPQLKVDPGSPLIVFAMREGKGLKALLPVEYLAKNAAERPGIFMNSPERKFVALRLDVPEDQAYHTVYHEYVHMVMGLNFQNLPLWLSEGLAELFAFAKLSDGESTLGDVSPELLQTLQKYSIMPVSALMAVTHDSPYYHRSDFVRVFYAQSWALTHYLMLGDKASHSKQLNEFMRLLQNGTSEQEASARALGDSETLEKNLRKYVGAGNFYHYQLRAQLEVKEDKYEARTLPLAESLALRGQFMVGSNRLDEAKAMFEQALQMDSNNAEANEGAGLLYMRLGNRDEAVKYFTAAAQLNSGSFLAQYYAGEAEYQGGRNYGVAEAFLRKALEINPAFVPAYSLLAHIVSMEASRGQEALQLAERAISLEPAELRHALNKCRILMSMDRFDEAELYASKILSVAHTEKDRSEADSIIAVVRLRRSQILEARRSEEAAAEELRNLTKAMEERRKQELERRDQPGVQAPAQIEASAIKRGPAGKAMGVIKSVKCEFPAVMDIVLNTAGGLRQFRAENYYQVRYWAVGAPGKTGFEPCEELEGKRVTIEYQSVTDQEFAGFISTVGIEE